VVVQAKYAMLHCRWEVHNNYELSPHGNQDFSITHPRFAHSPTHPKPWCALVNESEEEKLLAHSTLVKLDCQV
jgi:hypothetical protein